MFVILQAQNLWCRIIKLPKYNLKCKVNLRKFVFFLNFDVVTVRQYFDYTNILSIVNAFCHEHLNEFLTNIPLAM